jgi:hypothetical protein
MPLAVMGLGLAWLMSSSGERRARGDAAYEPRSFTGDAHGGLSRTAHHIGEKASDLISGSRDRFAGAASAAGDAGRSAVHGVSATAETALEKAAQYRDQAKSSFARVLETEPLVIGALGLVVGAAIGAALPHTELEDRAVGPLRDRLVDRGKDLAQDGLQQVGAAAQAAYAGVKDELSNPPEGAGLTDRVDTAARAGVSAARDQVQGQSS